MADPSGWFCRRLVCPANVANWWRSRRPRGSSPGASAGMPTEVQRGYLNRLGMGIFAEFFTTDQASDRHQAMLSKSQCFFSLPVQAWCLVCLAVAACWHAPAFARSDAEPVTLSAAREALLRDGWQPWETHGVFPDGLRWNQDGDAGILYKHGFKEVEACSGTGANYCSFNYVRGGKCLTLHTQGEFAPGQYEPLVIRRSMTCPRADITRPAQPAPR